MVYTLLKIATLPLQQLGHIKESITVIYYLCQLQFDELYQILGKHVNN